MQIHNLCLWIDENRADLVPAVQKLIEKLSGWDEDEKNPVNVPSNNAKASTLTEDLLKLVTNFIEHGKPLLLTQRKSMLNALTTI